MTIDPIAEASLFEVEQPPPITLADKFGVPPMSVLDRRSGVWIDRKRSWLSMGIQSEMGRQAPAFSVLQTDTGAERTDFFANLHRAGNDSTGALVAGGTSVFDPVLCELVYRWFSRAGDRVLDPFAGGSVRGVTASTLGRYYTGVDLRTAQVDANEAQRHLCSEIAPRWIVGDAAQLPAWVGADFDLLFSCPPYADLERYSDDPLDLSAMSYDDFKEAHGTAIRKSAQRLRRDRFACWVISDVRDKRGTYRGLVLDTVAAFRAAGLEFYNDAVLLDPVGAAALRAERSFRGTRKLTRVHQHLLVFVKGDASRAARRLESTE